jgi:hypothetical protein
MTAGPTQTTLMLSIDAWDLALDGGGNLMIATPPYSTAQDVASAVRTFLNELFFDQSVGVPYTQQILGQIAPLSVIQDGIETAALTVPGVLTAIATINAVEDRQVTGQVDFTTSDGDSVTVGI